MQKSRDRDFSNTRLSYSRRLNTSTDRPVLSVSRKTPNEHMKNYNQRTKKESKICVNCYNHQLSVDRHTQKVTEQHQPQQAMTLSKLGMDRDNKKMQVLKANEFNLKKIQQNQRKRLQEKQRSKVQSFSQLPIQTLKDLDQKRELEQRKRNKLRQDLEKQIALARQRKYLQAQQIKSGFPSTIITKDNHEKERQLIEISYKQDLLRQINQQRNKKHEQEQMNKATNQDNQLYFILNADNKRKAAQIREVTFKEMTRNELQRKNQLQKNRKELNAQQREQQTRNRLNEEKRLKQITEQSEYQRREKIQKYICDLKKQMQENASKRSQQFKWIAKQSNNCLIVPKKDTEAEPCSCCKKQTPSQQLSSYIRQAKRS